MPLPAPRTWTNGESYDSIPDAADLNLDWRDSFDFLLGTSRPMAYVEHTTSQTIVAGAAALAINFHNEILKRGGMVHSNVTNNSRVTVPYTGQYSGYLYLGWATVTTLTSKFSVRLRKNGTTVIFRASDMGPAVLGGSEVHGAFTVDLAANDYVEMVALSTGSGAATSVTAATRPKMAIWYSGDYV